jgi:hypothetical protein
MCQQETRNPQNQTRNTGNNNQQTQQGCVNTNQSKPFELIKSEVLRVVIYSKGRDKLEAEREAILSQKCNHSTTTYTKKSFTKQYVRVIVNRGQFFTSYKDLAEIWNCSVKQARGQLKRFVDKDTVKADRLKDSKNFDIGLLITYKWLFNHEKERQKRYKEKQGNYKKPSKPHKKNTQKKVNNQKGNLKLENYKKNYYKKKEESGNQQNQKKEVVFSFKKDLKFQPTTLKLKNLKFNDFRIEKFYTTYTKTEIEDYLRLLELNRQRGKVRNAQAWFTSALGNFNLEPLKDKEEEEKKEEEAERQKQELRRQEAEKEAKKQERIRKYLENKKKKLEAWRQKNSIETENKIFFEELKKLKTENPTIYKFYVSEGRTARLEDQSLIERLKKSAFMNSRFTHRVIAEVEEVKREDNRQKQNNEQNQQTQPNHTQNPMPPNWRKKKLNPVLNPTFTSTAYNPLTRDKQASPTARLEVPASQNNPITPQSQFKNALNQLRADGIRSGRIKIDRTEPQSLGEILNRFKGFNMKC